MKKYLCLLILGLFAASGTRAEQAASPRAFAEQLADQIMKEVVLSKSAMPEKQAAFRRVFLEATNIRTIARFTLGRYYKSATEEQREAFISAFTDNVILTWTERFSNYAGEQIKFRDTRQDKNDFYVNSTLDIPNTENDIEIIWRISDKKGHMQLVDLVVEGVSMIMSYRNEYASVLQQNGGDVQTLINMLNNKNKALLNPPKK
ncbi:MAG: phospholipid-binding protein MlaC [Alphaproteobacteria bacterium]